MTIREMSLADTEAENDNEKGVGLIKFREQYTYDTLKNAIYGLEYLSSIELDSRSASTFYSNILTSILDGFVQSYNFETAIDKAVSGEMAIEDTFVDGLGGFETLTKMEPVNS